MLQKSKDVKNKELLASDALQVIEDYKIQLLIVTDEDNKLAGVLHIHDLIEAGIKWKKKVEEIEEELVRLNKFLSHNSNYSRREADKLIEEGVK